MQNPDKNATEKVDTDRLRSDVAAVGTDAAALAAQAVDAIRKAADAFATQAGVKTDEALSAARYAKAATVDGLGYVARETGVVTEESVDALGRSVARNPLTALAIAAGAGLVLGWMTRSDPHR
jgi:hypothetical protein